ncbi:MAG: hypothetical protein AAGC84_00075 [Pseudomonas sp.]
MLLDYLQRQTQAAAHIVIVGSEPKDVEGLDVHPLLADNQGTILLSQAGLTIQRNVGLEALRQHTSGVENKDWFVIFYDDDFRPAPNWTECAGIGFAEDGRIAGLTGNVLADGVSTEFGINETDAAAYINGSKPAENHWSSSPQTKILTGLYGCNMAYRGTVAAELRFDESLPMYGWQEDYDYSSRARQFGEMVRYPACRGVHLGSSGGRTSGVRFGYSQISNPIFLVRKGSMTWSKALKLISKNFIANLAKTILRVPIKDFPGRLKGNYLACVHLLSGKLHPQNILKI